MKKGILKRKLNWQMEENERLRKTNYDVATENVRLLKKETELNETLAAFEEIKEDLTYYKGFHDGVKNGAKVNFSPTINQQPKKEFASGGITEAKPHDDRCEAQKRDEREFCKPLNPRPETVDNIMDFSAKLKESENKAKSEPVSHLQRIFENFIGSDAKGLIICAGEPPNEVMEALEAALEKTPKVDDEQLKQTPATDEEIKANDEGIKAGNGTNCNPR